MNNILPNINTIDDKFNKHKQQQNSEIITINDLLKDIDKKMNDNSNEKMFKLFTNEITKLKTKNEEKNEKICKLEEKLEKTDHKLKKILKYLKIE